MASLREKLRLADVPKPLQGLGIAFYISRNACTGFLGFLRYDSHIERGF